jgi:uncharacterized DUF497 family protein
LSVYEWDSAKAKLNQKDHGIDFADVDGVFEDELAIGIEDPDAEGEQRFVKIGADNLGRLLVVVYAYREGKIRLISARKANRREVNIYAQRI